MHLHCEYKIYVIYACCKLRKIKVHIKILCIFNQHYKYLIQSAKYVLDAISKVLVDLLNEGFIY